jgi:hypothetical protein
MDAPGLALRSWSGAVTKLFTIGAAAVTPCTLPWLREQFVVLYRCSGLSPARKPLCPQLQEQWPKIRAINGTFPMGPYQKKEKVQS